MTDLVIYKGSIVCGKSAKSERNQISAIRRALFEFDDHRDMLADFFSKSSSLLAYDNCTSTTW